jgi:16S rRNA (cytosine967-C5)-methyltransferase
MAATARIAACEVLTAVESGAVDLPAALERSRRVMKDERDRALAAEIATGTLRWRGQLDFVIDAAVERPERLTRQVRTILRLSAYQLLHLDRVPPRAVVSDAVDLTRACGQASAAGLVNAALRRLADPARRPALPGREHPLDYLSATCSLPRWLARRWLDRLGLEDAESWARFCNAPAPVTIRANGLKTTVGALAARLAGEGIAVAPARWAPDALVVTSGNVLRAAALADGSCLVQDEASQVVALATGASPGERVLDTCASPGGKATAMAAALGDTGSLVAVDLRPGRVALLRRMVGQAGAKRVAVIRADARRGLPFGAVFDVAVVDAPCSGLGTIRRDPDVKWRRAEADLARFAETQRDLLRQAAAVVRPGGRLLYATCSSEPEENDEVVDAVLAERADLLPVSIGDQPGWPGGLRPLLDRQGRLRTEPHRHGLEAFFAALVVRRR